MALRTIYDFMGISIVIMKEAMPMLSVVTNV